MILGDTQQLENALANLAANARDAMPTGGRLTISTSLVDLTEEDVRQHATMKPGRYATVTVTDTGLGMDNDTKARVFEPFFTTKDRGKGTGLGLSMVYGVVRQMDGFIWLYSELGHGTTFRMYFPTTSERPRTRAQMSQVRTRKRRKATILVIDDDRQVREYTLRALSRNGYTALGASGADDARQQLRQMAARPDLVLVDVILPETSGPDLIPMLGVNAARVLFMSGYSETPIETRGVVATNLLEKPFTVEDLLSAVDAALAD